MEAVQWLAPLRSLIQSTNYNGSLLIDADLIESIVDQTKSLVDNFVIALRSRSSEITSDYMEKVRSVDSAATDKKATSKQQSDNKNNDVIDNDALNDIEEEEEDLMAAGGSLLLMLRMKSRILWPRCDQLSARCA